MSVVLNQYQAILLDLDGTVYQGDHPLPGAVELIRQLQENGRPFACLSNSTSSPLRIMTRMSKMGILVDPSRIYTAAAAAADYVVETYGPRPRIFNLATEGVREMLADNVDFVQTDAEPCHAIIVGAPVNVYATEERQRLALSLARRGAAIVGICSDRVYPSQRGIEFGAGALSAMLAYASGSEVVYTGKPQEIFFHKLCHRINVQPAKCLLIGDNIEADIAGAKPLGMKTTLVLTGVTRRRDLRTVPKKLKPDSVIEDLTELLA